MDFLELKPFDAHFQLGMVPYWPYAYYNILYSFNFSSNNPHPLKREAKWSGAEVDFCVSRVFYKIWIYFPELKNDI